MKKIRNLIKKYRLKRNHAISQIDELNSLYEKTTTAADFLHKADIKIRETLKDPQNWKNYNELSYVTEMNDWF